MKVDCIKNNNLSFTAGKVSLYSDFDGTYFPEWQPNLYDITPERVNELNTHFDSFNNFFENTKGDLTFKITTGRTFGEFEKIAEIIKSKGIILPYPESFVSKNGSDEFIKTDNSGFYSKNFPFDYNTTNTQKQKEIEQLTGWTSGLKAKLKEILGKFNFEIIEHDSENPPKDHGEKSLFSRLNYDSFELHENMPAQSEWKVGLRRDGNLKLSVSFPYDMLHAKERKEAYSQIKSEFEEYLKQQNVKFISTEFQDEAGGKRPTLEVVPKIEDAPLTKLYDTKRAVKDAILNNDLVITAGDGINDLEMLNPLNYIDGEKSLTNPETVKELKKLPFAGIVIKGEKSGLEDLYKTFGEYGKIIEVEKGHLQDGIIQAIREYAKENPEFAKKMSKSLKLETELTEKTVKQTLKLTKKSSKLIAFIASAAAGISGLFLVMKNKIKSQLHSKTSP